MTPLEQFIKRRDRIELQIESIIEAGNTPLGRSEYRELSTFINPSAIDVT